MGLEAEEYSRLSREIEFYGQMVMRTSAVAFGLYMAILGYGITSKNGTIISCSLLPIILTVIMLCEIYSAMDRTSSYIKEVYEGRKNNIYWETRLQMKRKSPGYKSQRISMMHLTLFFIYVPTTLISISYFLKFEYQLQDIHSIYTFSSLLLIEFIGFIIGMRSISRRKKDYDKLKEYWSGIIKN